MRYDYIIVGAGSAGCVLASRLSEDPSRTVLLLEAGGKGNYQTSIPGAYPTLHRSAVDWAFWTAPQPQVHNRKLFIPRGKVLGGCSTTNAMAYVRGNPGDYNQLQQWFPFRYDSCKEIGTVLQAHAPNYCICCW